MLRPLVLVALIGLPAFAQDTAWPAEFVAIIKKADSLCQGDFTVAPESAVQRDLNGDGTPDWVLDTGGFACSDSYGLYCGTKGCAVETLIDGVRGSLLLRRWEVVTEGGTTYITAPNDKLETVRFLWTGSEWQLQ